jgi:multidrug efflux pump subunit AcrA (membrane-fusion protein)
MPQTPGNNELRSQEVNEILSETPRWIMRWGITVVFILIVIGIALLKFISYPDIITTDITITAGNSPAVLNAKCNGKLATLLIQNRQQVRKGQMLAVIENAADYSDVNKLEIACRKMLDDISPIDTIPLLQLDEKLQVGEITPAYMRILGAIKDCDLFKQTNAEARQISSLKSKLANLRLQLTACDTQLSLDTRKWKQAESAYEQEKIRFDEKISSAAALAVRKNALDVALRTYERSEKFRSGLFEQVNRQEKTLLELQIQHFEMQNKLRKKLRQYLEQAIQEIQNWKRLYVFESPFDGSVVFAHELIPNQNIVQGEELFTVIHDQEQTYLGNCLWPMTNADKPEAGQLVNIKLDNYSYSEYGMLVGKVERISEDSSKNAYLIEVGIINGLTTTYNKTLVYRSPLKGKAEIITRNVSVMDRLFSNYKK